ncbi:MAG: hypothetical protein KC613_02540, partial [Myxococcales bacterium]|nr:hypothetical protein [Myxococcales bacterium]
MAETVELARDVIAAPDRGLGAALSTFATGLGDRYLGFGIGRAPAESALVDRVFDRWQPLGRGAQDLSVFGDDALGGLAHEWGSYDGYTWGFEAGGPFVIPVDPVEHPTGFTAQHTRRPSRRAPFVAQSRQSERPRPTPVARETWRATTEA